MVYALHHCPKKDHIRKVNLFIVFRADHPVCIAVKERNWHFQFLFQAKTITEFNKENMMWLVVASIKKIAQIVSQIEVSKVVRTTSALIPNQENR